KIKSTLVMLTTILGIYSMFGQQRPLRLEQAIELALSNSEKSMIADTKVSTAGYELKSTKSNRYPDLELSGQYLKLAKAKTELKIDFEVQQRIATYHNYLYPKGLVPMNR